MKFRTILILVVILAALLFFLGWSPIEGAAKDREKYEEPFEKTLALAKGGRVEVRNVSGDIEVETWDRGEVRIEALKVSRASTQEKARENAQKVRIEVQEKDGLLLIQTDYPKLSIKGLNVSVSFHLRIPSEASIKAKSISGDVTLRAIGGKAEAETVSGDAEVVKAGQGVKAESVSGNITVTDAPKGVYGKSVSGNIHVRSTAGNVELHTISGDIKAESGEGDVEAESVSGEVELVGLVKASVVKVKSLSGTIVYEGDILAGGRYAFKAHSGNIRLRIPPDSAFDFEASTFSGDIHTEFEILASGKISRKEIQGMVNGGGADVSLKTFSGDIFIEKK